MRYFLADVDPFGTEYAEEVFVGDHPHPEKSIQTLAEHYPNVIYFEYDAPEIVELDYDFIMLEDDFSIKSFIGTEEGAALSAHEYPNTIYFFVRFDQDVTSVRVEN